MHHFKEKILKMSFDPPLLRQEEWVKDSPTTSMMHMPNNDGKVIATSVYKKGRVLWSKKVQTVVSGVKINNKEKGGMYKYKINSIDYHSLVSSVVIATIPKIVMKDGYLIKSCDKFLANLIKNWNLDIDSKVIQGGTNLVTLIELEKSENYEEKCRLMGDNYEPSSTFSETQVCIQLPFSHNQGIYDSFPLYLFGGKNDISINLVLDLDLSSNFVMYKVGTKEPIEFDLSHIKYSDPFLIPIVTLTYTVVTKHECQHGCFIEGKEEEIKRFPMTNYIVYVENPCKANEKNNITFLKSKSCQPITEICWGAINEKETSLLRSIVFNSKNGLSPIVETTLSSKFEKKIDKVPSYMTEKSNNLGILKRVPIINGLNYWLSTHVPVKQRRDDYYEPGEAFEDGLLECNLGGLPEEEFRLFCVMKEIYFISVQPNHATDKEKHTSTSLVNIIRN
jgi:hypothetical protein